MRLKLENDLNSYFKLLGNRWRCGVVLLISSECTESGLKPHSTSSSSKSQKFTVVCRRSFKLYHYISIKIDDTNLVSGKIATCTISRTVMAVV